LVVFLLGGDHARVPSLRFGFVTTHHDSSEMLLADSVIGDRAESQSAIGSLNVNCLHVLVGKQLAVQEQICT